MNTILFGFKNSGKSTFAKQVGLPYIDTDTLLGMDPREIVKTKGPTYFQKMEGKWIQGLDVTGHIIAVGGSTVFNPKNLKKLKSLGTLIYLKCPKALLKKRILSPPLPSFIDETCPEESFERIYSQRIPMYEKIPAKTIDLEDKTDEQVVEEIWQVINSDKIFASPLGESPMAKP